MLFNPKTFTSSCPDEPSRDIMAKTIKFFERKGKRRLKEDDQYDDLTILAIRKK